MQAFLKKHGPGVAVHSVRASWVRQGDLVTIDFKVQKRNSSPWISDPSFTEDYKQNWGLWEKDVVEAFLQLRSHPGEVHAPYLELQVSPRNQPFALVIVEPRLQYFPPQELKLRTEAATDPRSWTAKIEVTLPPTLKGDLLYGGFFACLSGEPREFYASEPNPEPKPDFHQPALFLPLDP
jgi:hypothetical protein